LILSAGAEILQEKEGFQFGFKRLTGLSNVL